MKSHEVMRQAFKQVGCKRVAAELKLSLSLVEKWARPNENAGSGKSNPLDRVEQILRLTGDRRLVEWLCRQAGGYFVPNTPGKRSSPDLFRAQNAAVREMTDLAATLVTVTEDKKVTRDEALTLRSRWENAKSVTEGFVQACERGVFRNGAMLWALGWWLATGDLPKLGMVEV